MSGCVNAGQALSRGLKLCTPRNSQALPFLYQTATLRRYYSEDQAQSRDDRNDGPSLPVIRKVSDESTSGEHRPARGSQFNKGPRNFREPRSESRFKKAEVDQDYVPFESSKSPQIDERPARVSKFKRPETSEDFVPFEKPEGVETVVPEKPTTMTEAERKTFEKLEALASKKKASFQEENLFESLDDVLNEALANVQTAGHSAPEKSRSAKKGNPLTVSKAKSTTVSKAKSTTVSKAKSTTVSKAKSTTVSKAKSTTVSELKQLPTTATTTTDLQEKETNAILEAIRSSKTDTQVWETLERELFTPIASLNLDETPNPSTTPQASEMSPTQRRNLMNEFPKHLCVVAFILRVDYPDSDMILSLIPKLRSLGPSVYALGASPKLYNQVIAFLFEKYTDVDSINQLLAEMEREVIEPNEVTLSLLDYVEALRQRVQKYGHGVAVRTVWGTEKYKRSFEVLGRWRDRVERLLTEREIRVARRKKASEVESAESDDAPLVQRVNGD